MVSKNSDNLPTYFQLGRNSIEALSAVFVQDPKNKGLRGFQGGRRQNIPVQANILSKADSGERLNLQQKVDSPQRRFAAKLRVAEGKFKE